MYLDGDVIAREENLVLDEDDALGDGDAMSGPTIDGEVKLSSNRRK